MATPYEYRIRFSTFEELALEETERDLNELGAEGWEAVATVKGTGADSDEILIILKRPRGG